MLFRLVEEKVAVISRLDVERDAVAFAEQVLARNPEPFRLIPRPVSLALVDADPEASEVDRLAALLLARAQLRLILELPAHVEELVELVHAQVSPHVRMAMLGALAYLVQPATLVCDDAPGGYGFVDDCIVIKTMRLAMARMGMPVVLDEGRELRALSLLALALSPEDFCRMQTLMTRMWNEIHLLHMMTPNVAAARAQRILLHPLDVHHDWTTPMPPITRTFPTLCEGMFGDAQDEGITIAFRDGGTIVMTTEGNICGYH
ncbi:hypothetical protein [Paraliomyxa miuraensis]|uniref:hypothetical protein n=1 Tax=Paraliomyxa miuraensis TaxID=376150 RepID=UPI00225642E8|nr:hypothetical protein [Paraliomyxa miuraensis]MCX4247947.1 hypothetical protein [Paraliomyxa miuraensis]